MRTRCPSCGFSYMTDRGVLTHEYEGSSDDERAAAGRELRATAYDVPLFDVDYESLPPWLKALGDQQSLPGLLREIADSIRMPPSET